MPIQSVTVLTGPLMQGPHGDRAGGTATAHIGLNPVSFVDKELGKAVRRGPGVIPQDGHGTGVADGIQVNALGLVIQLRFDDRLDDDLRGQIAEAWSGAAVSATEPAVTLKVLPGQGAEQLMESLSTQVTLAALEASEGKLLTFHAAGAALDDGRVIAFVGPSGHGKTTLIGTLGMNYGYVSDETVAVDETMKVYPYRKPLSVVRHKRPKRQVAPRAAGLLDLPDGPLRLAALVLLNRDPNATEVAIESVPILSAITQLLPEMSYTASLKLPLQQIASLCQRLGGVQRMTYYDVALLPGVVDQLLQPSQFDESWTPAGEVLSTGQRLQLGNITDAIDCSGELAVFSDQTMRVLSGIAPAIWHAVRAGKSFDGIVQAVVEQHGIPDSGDPALLVDAVINDLVVEGLLCRIE